MNCRAALFQIATERDNHLEDGARSRLEAHLATCASCRQVRAEVAAALEAWRASTASVKVPDPNHEWLEARRCLRGGTNTETTSASSSRRLKLAWLALPLTAAVLAVALFLPRPTLDETTGTLSPTMARADSVDVPGGSTSTMVFVDDQSGWLIVWATDAAG